MEQSGAIMGKASNGEKKPGEKKGGQWVFWCLQACSSFPTRNRDHWLTME